MAVPAAVPAVGIVITMEALLSWVVAAGLLFVYRVTVSLVLLFAADQIGGIGISGRFRPDVSLEPLANIIRRVDADIQQAFEDWVRGNEIIIAATWDAITGSLRSLGALVADTAESVAHTYSHVWRTLIPQAEDRAVQRAKRAGAGIAATVAQLATVAIPALGAADIVLGGRIARHGDALSWLRARVDRHANLLTGAGVAVLGLRILDRVGLKMIRCGNVRSNLRRFCGLDPRVLDAFLIGATVLALPIGLEAMTRALVKAEAEFVETLFGGVSELRRIPKADRDRILSNLERGLAKL